MTSPEPLVPRDKFDTTTAERAVAAGYPAVAPVLGELLAWIQDCNWPVALVQAPFLASIGPPIAPDIRTILQSGDDCWKYWVLERVVAQNPSVLAEVRPELERIRAAPRSAGSIRPGAVLAAPVFSSSPSPRS